VIAHALPSAKADRFAGRAAVRFEEGDVTVEQLAGRCASVEQPRVVGHVQGQVQQAVAHLSHHLAPLVGGLGEVKRAAAYGIGLASHFQLGIERRHQSRR
jgi:hypothetical protein